MPHLPISPAPATPWREPAPPRRARGGHDGGVLRVWAGAALAALALALASLLARALVPALVGWLPALPAAERGVLSWGFVPLAAGTLALWRRSAAPMRAGPRELWLLGAALLLAACALAVLLDLALGGQLGAATLDVGLAIAVGCGLLAPPLLHGARARAGA